MDMQHPSRLRSPLWPRAAVGLVTALCLVCEAGAVVTLTQGYNGTRTLTMRVGTPTAGTIDTVQFDVENSPSGNSRPTAASVNGNGIAIPASSGGVVIDMNMKVPSGNAPQSMTTTVSSPVALTCLLGGCGGATIPFSSISWVVTPTPSGQYAAIDWKNGTFVGGTAQQVLSFTLSGGAGIVDAQSTLNFSYANTTAYPAGTYSGTVTYTASLP